LEGWASFCRGEFKGGSVTTLVSEILSVSVAQDVKGKTAVTITQVMKGDSKDFIVLLSMNIIGNCVGL